MMKVKVEPKNVEAPFNEDEMFFSITDKKGIILSGNPVFVRVSSCSGIISKMKNLWSLM